MMKITLNITTSTHVNKNIKKRVTDLLGFTFSSIPDKYIKKLKDKKILFDIDKSIANMTNCRDAIKYFTKLKKFGVTHVISLNSDFMNSIEKFRTKDIIECFDTIIHEFGHIYLGHKSTVRKSEKECEREVEILTRQIRKEIIAKFETDKKSKKKKKKKKKGKKKSKS